MEEKTKIQYDFAYNSKGKPETCTEAKKSEQYICPYCYHEMIVKQGERNAWHFAHKSNPDDSICAKNNGKSEEEKKIYDNRTHALAVELLIKFIQTKMVKIIQKCNRCFTKFEKIFDNEPLVNIHKEYRLEDGFADIALEKDGEIFVFEVFNTHRTIQRKNVWWCEIEARDIIQAYEDIIQNQREKHSAVDDCTSVQFDCKRNNIYCKTECKSMKDLAMEFGFARQNEPLENYVKRNEKYKEFIWYYNTNKYISPGEIRSFSKRGKCIKCCKGHTPELNFFEESRHSVIDIQYARNMDKKNYPFYVFCEECRREVSSSIFLFQLEITEEEREYAIYKIAEDDKVRKWKMVLEEERMRLEEEKKKIEEERMRLEQEEKKKIEEEKRNEIIRKWILKIEEEKKKEEEKRKEEQERLEKWKEYRRKVEEEEKLRKEEEKKRIQEENLRRIEEEKKEEERKNKIEEYKRLREEEEKRLAKEYKRMEREKRKKEEENERIERMKRRKEKEELERKEEEEKKQREAIEKKRLEEIRQREEEEKSKGLTEAVKLGLLIWSPKDPYEETKILLEGGKKTCIWTNCSDVEHCKTADIIPTEEERTMVREKYAFLITVPILFEENMPCVCCRKTLNYDNGPEIEPFLYAGALIQICYACVKKRYNY